MQDPDITLSDWIHARCRTSDREALKIAAEIAGKSETDFIRDTLLDAAQRRIARARAT